MFRTARRLPRLLGVALYAAICPLLPAQGSAPASHAPGTAARDLTPVLFGNNGPNTPAQQAKPYVVLVSLDGFRYSYPRQYQAPHLLELAHRGVSAPDGMLPSFPSLTFPNHYTLITGLYPEHHGIVSNIFYDPARKATYTYTRPETNSDGSWYGGTPLWSLAEQQGMRSACLFWPGSEAEIAGKRPSYYLHFDNGVDDHTRIDQVLAWLALPPDQRPHLITLYYAKVDHAGHTHGPDSTEVRDAVHQVDDLMGELEDRLRGTGLPVDLIVLSDHGMATLKRPPVSLSDLAELGDTRVQGHLLYPPTEAATAKLFAELKAHPDPRFSVYRRADVPAPLHFNENAREGDPVIIPNGPYAFYAHASSAPESTQPHGEHGYDPHTMPEMKAIFFAAGPDFAHNKRLKSFENVDVYPLITQILGLHAPAVDGSLQPVRSALTRRARRRHAS